VSFSPDGNSIYFIKDETGEKDVTSLYRAPVLGGSPERIIHDIYIYSNISFSPDRARIVFIRQKPNEGEGDLIIANADGSNEKLLSKQNTRLHSPSWSPDGKLIVATELLANQAALSALDMFDSSTGEKQVFKQTDMLLGYRPMAAGPKRYPGGGQRTRIEFQSHPDRNRLLPARRLPAGHQ
jgi:Tol biopolymer transport system component